MADLSYIEKRHLEKILGMGSGYVLDFSNRTFEEFVVDSTGKNIYDEKYSSAGGSKANRLRAFWDQEPNHVVAKLMGDLLEYSRNKASAHGEAESPLFQNCDRIVQRLKQGASVPELDALSPDVSTPNFETLTKQLRTAIDNNEPESALDRLHTYVVKFVRDLCRRYGISTEREKPLHSLFGEYITSD